ncbi:hypothetical protein JCM10449v2_004865 [Rhodotorula kratochvilovae]
MAPHPELLPPAVVPTLCLVNLVAAASVSSQPAPHLNALFALALECTHELSPPLSLQRWLDRARGDEPSDAFAAQITDIQQTVQAVRARGMDDALHWLANESRTLVAPTDDDELTLTLHTPPPPLLRASPLGAYVRRAALAFAKLELDQTLEWWAAFERCFARARLQQDYHAAREHLRTFVPAGQRDAMAQQALLHLALVEYEDGGLEAAQMALDEATQIARTVGDTTCLAALRLRLDATTPPNSGSARKIGRAARASPHDLLWELSERCAAGAPLATLFPLLLLSRASAQHLAFPPPPAPASKPDPAHPSPSPAGAVAAAPDPAFDAAWHAAAAGLWGAMGIDPLARVHAQLVNELDDPHQPAWDVRLAGLAQAVDSHDDAPFTRLTRAATAAHAALSSQRERLRLSSLLTLLSERQRAGGAPERGLRELEEAWSAVLALEEEEGALGVRAREGRAVGLAAARTDDAVLPELVDELSTLAERYLSLDSPSSAQRALLAAAQLADHLVASCAPGAWEERRDALARRWLAVERREGAEEREGVERERWERVRRVERLVERAVEGANR